MRSSRLRAIERDVKKAVDEHEETPFGKYSPSVYTFLHVQRVKQVFNQIHDEGTPLLSILLPREGLKRMEGIPFSRALGRSVSRQMEENGMLDNDTTQNLLEKIYN